MRRRLTLAVLAGAIVVPVSAAPAAETPPIHCDPVSCTELIERRVEGVTQCVSGAVTAMRYVLQGTPQPQVCNV